MYLTQHIYRDRLSLNWSASCRRSVVLAPAKQLKHHIWYRITLSAVSQSVTHCICWLFNFFGNNILEMVTLYYLSSSIIFNWHLIIMSVGNGCNLYLWLVENLRQMCIVTFFLTAVLKLVCQKDSRENGQWCEQVDLALRLVSKLGSEVTKTATPQPSLKSVSTATTQPSLKSVSTATTQPSLKSVSTAVPHNHHSSL